MSQQFQTKPGARATWRLTTEGLTIVVTQSESGRQGQTDQIPVQAIREVTLNRYSPLCLVTLYVDPTHRFNALICRCESEQDASQIVQVFQQLQRTLSGEGYRIDLKQPRGINWTLKSKQNGEGGLNGHHDDLNGSIRSQDGGVGKVNNNNYGEVVVETEEETLEREPLEVDGRSCFNVGVQAELMGEDDSDRDSTASDISYQSLKDELISLSNEVRDIKLLLEQTTGISAEEFFRRQREEGGTRLMPVKRFLSQESDGAESGSGEKRVNFAAPPGEGAGDEDMDFDIRSVGMQTADTGSKRGKYMKRVRHALTPSRYQQGHHGRLGSNSSPQTSPSAGSAQFSPLGSQAGSYFTYSLNGQRRVDPRRDIRYGSASLSRASLYSSGGTVVRPIESVYQANAHTPGFRQKRKQVIVLPHRSASVPRPIRRTASDSVAQGGTRDEAPKAPAAAPTQNGAS